MQSIIDPNQLIQDETHDNNRSFLLENIYVSYILSLQPIIIHNKSCPEQILKIRNDLLSLGHSDIKFYVRMNRFTKRWQATPLNTKSFSPIFPILIQLYGESLTNYQPFKDIIFDQYQIQTLEREKLYPWLHIA